ncbi:chaperone modulator CbpM [Candidatus Acidulodesulfobacterium sp. H_13]|uniref:chaperone modulator CbpM n=1 Tax=Candidatus Acidulodesulfobacterium sp. H_13 TaxID=3395470 RepID=UPI003AF57ACC
MDCCINLASFCNKINLDNESVMFFVYEGVITVERQENEFYIDDKTADILRFISEIKNDLGVNDEGVSVIIGLRKRIIDYQNKIKIMFDIIDNSKSIDELISMLKNNKAFNETEDNDNGSI